MKIISVAFLFFYLILFIFFYSKNQKFVKAGANIVSFKTNKLIDKHILKTVPTKIEQPKQTPPLPDANNPIENCKYINNDFENIIYDFMTERTSKLYIEKESISSLKNCENISEDIKNSLFESLASCNPPEKECSERAMQFVIIINHILNKDKALDDLNTTQVFTRLMATIYELEAKNVKYTENPDDRKKIEELAYALSERDKTEIGQIGNILYVSLTLMDEVEKYKKFKKRLN